eukprot:2405759-Pleurochrysis_carterae.AAC.1
MTAAKPHAVRAAEPVEHGATPAGFLILSEALIAVICPFSLPACPVLLCAALASPASPVWRRHPIDRRRSPPRSAKSSSRRYQSERTSLRALFSRSIDASIAPRPQQHLGTQARALLIQRKQQHCPPLSPSSSSLLAASSRLLSHGIVLIAAAVSAAFGRRREPSPVALGAACRSRLWLPRLSLLLLLERTAGYAML